jgi:peroxiredoxin
MALTPSNMLALGTKAPTFELPDTLSGATIEIKEANGHPATVIMFICNHCPYVLHVNEELVRLSNEYIIKGVRFIAISSNDVENYPQDAPDKMKVMAMQLGYNFPYLYDESQQVAKAYDAACTPDFYVFDKEMTLVYRGRLDESRPESDIPLSGRDLRDALDAVLTESKISASQFPSMGCNIKWK